MRPLRSLRLPLSLASVAACAFALVGAASAAFPGGNGLIAYVSENVNSGGRYVTTTNPDGTGETTLPLAVSVYGLAWSADGTKIAWSLGSYLQVANGDGSDPISLTNALQPTYGYPVTEAAGGTFLDVAEDPAWSPDGSRLAFVGCVLDGCTIYTMDPGAVSPPSEVLPVAGTQGLVTSGGSISWSPNGTRIAFEAAAPERTINGVTFLDFYIDVVDLATGTVTQLTQNPMPGEGWVEDSNPDWSPDGSEIAFARVFSYPNPPGGLLSNTLREIWATNADGSGEIQLSRDELFGRDDPAWSPDCTKLVFLLNDNFVATSSADGSNEAVLNPDTFQPSSPSWQPVAQAGAVSCAPLAAPSAPETPSNVIAAASAGSASVAWTAPFDGGSLITSYTVTASDGTQISVRGDATTATLNGLANTASYTFTVRATTSFGSSPDSSPSNAVIPTVGTPPPLIASGAVGQGGSVFAGNGNSATDPLSVGVQSPNAGTITIATAPPDAPPTGFQFLGQQLDITAPPATAADPLTLYFTVDSSQLNGADPTTVDIFRDGTPVSPCTGTRGQADPDPCITQRFPTQDNGAELLVLSSHASHWNFGVAKPSDTTPPSASPNQSPAANGSGWNSTNVTVSWNWQDNAGGTGIDSSKCTTSSTSSGEGTITLSATCKDKAGNQGSASDTVKVDKTAPSVTVTGVANGGSYLFGSVPQAGCHTTDPLSGVATAASVSGGAGPGSAGSFTATCTGATDVAGNHAAAVSAQYTVGFTQPCITNTHSGSLTIASGTAVCISTGGKVSGSITVQSGGALWIGGGTVSGSLSSTGAKALTLCGAALSGSLTVTGSTGYLLTGGPSGSTCAGNALTGSVSITHNTGGLSFNRNTVTGSATITGNSGGFSYSGNTIHGSSTVSGNS